MSTGLANGLAGSPAGRPVFRTLQVQLAANEFQKKQESQDIKLLADLKYKKKKKEGTLL